MAFPILIHRLREGLISAIFVQLGGCLWKTCILLSVLCHMRGHTPASMRLCFAKDTRMSLSLSSHRRFCPLSMQGKRLPAYLSADAEEGEVSDDDSADEIEDDFKFKSSNVRSIGPFVANCSSVRFVSLDFKKKGENGSGVFFNFIST